MMDYYMLQGRTPVKISREEFLVRSKLGWPGVQIADDTIDGVRVSTVFLVLDHGFDPDGPPVLFETMIFGGERDGDMMRYHTYDEAEIGHRKMVGSLRLKVVNGGKS